MSDLRQMWETLYKGIDWVALTPAQISAAEVLRHHFTRGDGSGEVVAKTALREIRLSRAAYLTDPTTKAFVDRINLMCRAENDESTILVSAGLYLEGETE